MNEQMLIIEQASSELIQEAIQLEASDIHFYPSLTEYTIYNQKDGHLQKRRTIPKAMGKRMISHYKFLAKLDVTEHRKAQSGSFQKELDGKSYSFRVSTMPSMHEESVVIRLQKKDDVMSLDQLFTQPEWKQQTEKLLVQKQGLVVITGPTGSGKTTSLYSMITYCVNVLDRHVISLEDPVEHPVNYLLQVQVNEKTGFTYDAGLKAILRHSPDVIMIGEIRDSATALTAIRAALTGHLVLTTVHAKDNEGVIYRLLDLGVRKEELKQTLSGIFSQRLIATHEGQREAEFSIAVAHQLNHYFQQMDSVEVGEKGEDNTESSSTFPTIYL